MRPAWWRASKPVSRSTTRPASSAHPGHTRRAAVGWEQDPMTGVSSGAQAPSVTRMQDRPLEPPPRPTGAERTERPLPNLGRGAGPPVAPVQPRSTEPGLDAPHRRAAIVIVAVEGDAAGAEQRRSVARPVNRNWAARPTTCRRIGLMAFSSVLPLGAGEKRLPGPT